MTGNPADYLDRAKAAVESDVEGNRRAITYCKKAIAELEDCDGKIEYVGGDE